MGRRNDQPPNFLLAVTTVLLESIRVNVDTVYKVVHLPTALTSIESTRSNGKMTVSGLALVYAMYSMALCMITDDEADAIGLRSRAEPIGSDRADVKHFQATSGLLNYPDLTALSPFIIYPVSIGSLIAVLVQF